MGKIVKLGKESDLAERWQVISNIIFFLKLRYVKQSKKPYNLIFIALTEVRQIILGVKKITIASS